MKKDLNKLSKMLLFSVFSLYCIRKLKEVEPKYHKGLYITLRDSRYYNVSDSDFNNKIKIFSKILFIYIFI